MDSEFVGWYFDVGNCVRFAWPEHWVQVLGDRIFKLDIKEYSRKLQKEEGLWKGFGVELTEGSIDWAAVMRALDAIPYRGGWASAEVKGGDAERLTDIARRMDTIFSMALDEKSASKPKTGKDGAIPLFNGVDLTGWKSVNFGGEGEVRVEDGSVILEMGEPMTAVIYTGKQALPKTGYEVSLEAKKLAGNDFFCGLTFPVRDSHATFVVGGWGGGVVGISNIDGFDASENETANYMAFDKDRWYRIRVRVADERIEAWIDDDRLVDVDIKGRQVDLRFGLIDMCVPLGIANYDTRSAIRKVALKKVAESLE
jgi:hypothetical protein